MKDIPNRIARELGQIQKSLENARKERESIRKETRESHEELAEKIDSVREKLDQQAEELEDFPDAEDNGWAKYKEMIWEHRWWWRAEFWLLGGIIGLAGLGFSIYKYLI